MSEDSNFEKNNEGMDLAEKIACPECKGAGGVHMAGDCSDCNGKGYSWEPL